MILRKKKKIKADNNITYILAALENNLKLLKSRNIFELKGNLHGNVARIMKICLEEKNTMKMCIQCE